MKKYTIKQIDEIRAKAIQALDESENGKPVAWKNCKIKKVYRGFARAVRRADEKAGVLIITDDEPKEGDLIYSPDFRHLDDEIIRRDNKPVYQCKKEGEDEKNN